MYKILFSKLKKYNIYKILFIILILIIIFILLKKQYVIERFNTNKINKLDNINNIKKELNLAIETIKDYELFYSDFISKYYVNDVNDPNDPNYTKFKKESPFHKIVNETASVEADIKKKFDPYSVLNQDPATEIYEPTPNYDYKPIWNDINSIFNKSKKFIIHILKALNYIPEYYSFTPEITPGDITNYDFNTDIVGSGDDGGDFLDLVNSLIKYMHSGLNVNSGLLKPEILQDIYKSLILLIYGEIVSSDTPIIIVGATYTDSVTHANLLSLYRQQKHIKTTQGIIKLFNNSDNSNAYEKFKNLIVDLESYFGELIPFKEKLEKTPALEININKLKNTIDNEYITVKNALAKEKGVIKEAEENYQKNTYYLKVYDDIVTYYKIYINNDGNFALKGSRETDAKDVATEAADAALEAASAAKADTAALEAVAKAVANGISGKLTEADEIYTNNKNKIKFSINENSELEINLINPVIYNNEISKTNSIQGGTNSVGSFTYPVYDSKISDLPIMIDIKKDTNDYSTVKDYLIHFYLDKNINDIFDGNARNIIYTLNEIITEKEYNELQKQSKLKTTLGDDVEDLKEYNDLKNQYNNIMNNKEKRIKEHEEAQLYKRGQTILNKKISFNKKWIRTIKDITIGVHIFLYLVILVLVVYKLQ